MFSGFPPFATGIRFELVPRRRRERCLQKRRPLRLTALGAIQKEQVTMDAPREEQSLVSLPIRRVIDASGGTRLA